MAKKENIIVSGARTNNLKNVSVSFPIKEFSCVTGVSGCGKSSLVYDTVFAESQRSFLESMAGNMYGQKLMDKPEVDSIENLPPALNIAQRYYNSNPRSTLGTVTDISYYLRTLYALISNYDNGTSYTEGYFSPNNPSSWCSKCNGTGEEYVVSLEALVPDPSKTLEKGAILYYKGKPSSIEYKTLLAICEAYDIDPSKKFEDLSVGEKEILLYRKEQIVFNLSYKTPKGRYKRKAVKSRGVFVELEEKIKDIDTPSTFASISKYLEKQKCSSCGGSRLSDSVLRVKLCNKNIAEVEALKVGQLGFWIREVEQVYQGSEQWRQIQQLLNQISRITEQLVNLKVDYLNLNRTIPSLSGGEIQRVRIATQLTCSLRGLLYILDEPCRGLHIRDIDAVINATERLIEEGNTVIAIEHNMKYVSCANKVIELGPVGGPDGGYLISDNQPSSEYKYDLHFKPVKIFDRFIELENINYNNIHKQSTKFPIGAITCITGVSGSGKSSLVDVIANNLTSARTYNCDLIKGKEYIKKVEVVNQKPIGKNPRSTVVSYLGIYDGIRECFARTTEAIKHGLTASDFSMNVKGGRCEECQGTGYKKIELAYLPDAYIKCPSCNGQRFNTEVLNVKYKDYSINDVLESTVDEMVSVFDNNPFVVEKLKCMQKIGLGYLKIGQMSMTLSGGEAQRIKLARALGQGAQSGNIYIMDEPTSGLNEKDIARFEVIISELRDEGNTILIIEHNSDFIVRNAEYVIDFGCNSGDQGGIIVAQGSPEKVYNVPESSWSILV